MLLRLVERADVLVENFRPAVKHRLRIDPDTLWAVNPRLVYASISGFGQDGPYAERPGVDQIAQGLGGVMSVTGPPGTGPSRVGIAISDTAAGTILTQGVLAALIARDRTGRGQWVHTSLLESMISFMDFQAARWLIDHDVPGQVGNQHPTIVPMGTFPTADGYVNVSAHGRLRRLLLDDRRARDRRRPAVRRRRVAARAPRRARRASIGDAFRARNTAEWVDLLAEVVPCGPVLRIDEVFADPQVQHLGMTTTVDDPSGPARSRCCARRSPSPRRRRRCAAGRRRRARTRARCWRSSATTTPEIDALLETGAVATEARSVTRSDHDRDRHRHREDAGPRRGRHRLDDLQQPRAPQRHVGRDDARRPAGSSPRSATIPTSA